DAAVGEADQLVERPGRFHLVVDDELFGADDGDPGPVDCLAVGVEAGRDVGGHVLWLAAVGDGFDEGVDAGPGGRGGGRAGGFGGFGAHLVQLAFDGPVVGGAVGERAGDAGHEVGAAEQADGGHALPPCHQVRQVVQRLRHSGGAGVWLRVASTGRDQEGPAVPVPGDFGRRRGGGHACSLT